MPPPNTPQKTVKEHSSRPEVEFQEHSFQFTEKDGVLLPPMLKKLSSFFQPDSSILETPSTITFAISAHLLLIMRQKMN
ncbi:unnamed protein product [Penicillium camemberti]|uniref:Str. FM013 n=1 Tax=Penicillium camemberti (strain FM 013) TaxID=1429867 RepID=A0A0G4PV32_PENC3|nr:unnamed protein product [Penicillium camemberti]